MKKLAIMIFVLAFSFLMTIPVMAQDKWYQVNQFTAQWDAVTTDADGDPLPQPPDPILKYRLVMVNAVTDPNKTNPVVVAEVDAPTTQATITVGTKGQYFVGVYAVLVFSDGTEQPSGINWADEAADQNGNELWAIRHHAPPLNPQNLKK